MAEAWYLIGAVALAGGVTFALRALPFAALRPLRESKPMARLAAWMPAGLLAILALATMASASAGGSRWWQVLVAAAVTVAVHLATRRRTLISVAAGTITFVVLCAMP